MVIKMPIANGKAVYETAVPIMCIALIEYPIRNVPAAATNREKVVENANPLARTSVGYCSGSQIVNTAKFAPSIPISGMTVKNNVRLF